MKKFILAVIAISVIGMAGAVMAADTTTVTVSATIGGTCKFYSSGSINFTLDPSVGGPVTGIVSKPVFGCTKGTNYTITDDNGLYEDGEQHQMKRTGSDEYIPYSFGYIATGTGRGHGAGKRIELDITSIVQADAYLDVPAGTYRDTVTLTINP